MTSKTPFAAIFAATVRIATSIRELFVGHARSAQSLPPDAAPLDNVSFRVLRDRGGGNFRRSRAVCVGAVEDGCRV